VKLSLRHNRRDKVRMPKNKKVEVKKKKK
jgi:hypothetical protein